jgi:hypothetical protein
MKDDKTDCNNYRAYQFSELCTKILSSILLSRLTPSVEEIIEDYQCGFRRNSSTTDHIFCIRQFPEKNLELKELVLLLFIDFMKTYDSVKREVLCNNRFDCGNNETE